MNKEIIKLNKNLFVEIRQIVEDSRQSVDQTINANLTAMYWNIGKRINNDILENKRAKYDKQIVAILARQLTEEYGKGWSTKNLQHCLRFAETFPKLQIVSALWRQLSWTHFKTIMYLKSDLERDFYTQMSRIEKWSTRTLQRNN